MHLRREELEIKHDPFIPVPEAYRSGPARKRDDAIAQDEDNDDDTLTLLKARPVPLDECNWEANPVKDRW